MKIAVYHDEDIHFEMIGYILEYCYGYDVVPDVYSCFATVTGIGETYSIWYDKFFNRPIEWKNNSILDSDIDYDVVFLVTDDNPKYQIIKDKYIDKTISIDHWYKSRNEVRTKVGTRMFFNRPETMYAMPCYNIISEKEKIELLQLKNRLQVVFVGRFNFPSSFTFAFFNNFEDIDFHVIIWDMKPSYVKFLLPVPNLFIHSEIDTAEMMNIMKESHYVFFNPSYIEGYSSHKTSATLHLAFSTLVKPIIPKQWNDNYRFNNNLVIEYDDLEYIRPNNQLNLSIEDCLQSIKFIAKQRRNEIANRNIVFDNAIQNITGSMPPISKTSWITKTFSRLSLNYPNIFVGIETCIDNAIIKDFREIHMVNTVSTEILNDRHIYNYTGENTTDILSNTIDCIREPVVFFIDENLLEGQMYYNRLLSLLFRRDYNDIIVFNFTLSNNDYIPFIKNHSIYRFGNEPFTIMVPKYTKIQNEIFQVCIEPYNYKNIPQYVIDKIKESSVGYNYTLYNTNNILNIVDTFNPIFKRKYNSCLRSQHKKDIVQMVMLYNRGGIYVDIHIEPLSSFENIIKQTELKPTFVCVLGIDSIEVGIDSTDEIAVGLMACTKYNKIISLILNELYEVNFEEFINDQYALICKIVGHVLKKFMRVENLAKGFYEINGERILILNEIWNAGDYKSCKILYDDEILANTRYIDYPWNLNENN